MKKWVVEIYAKSNIDGEMATFVPDFYIEAPSFELAQAIAKVKYGWMHVVGEFIAEIPTDEKLHPIWEQMIDYDNIRNN